MTDTEAAADAGETSAPASTAARSASELERVTAERDLYRALLADAGETMDGYIGHVERLRAVDWLDELTRAWPSFQVKPDDIVGALAVRAEQIVEGTADPKADTPT